MVGVEGFPEATEGRWAVLTPHNQLGNHWVVVNKHIIARTESSVQTNFGVADESLLRLLNERKASASREKIILRRLRKDASFYAGSVQLQIRLREVEGLSSSGLNLKAHKVQRLATHQAHFLRDRVFHLKTGVHLHEEELVCVGVEDELNGSCTDVPDGLGCLHRNLANISTKLLGEVRSGCFLQHLLVPTLHTAVSLEEVHTILMLIAEHLHLNVAGPLNVPLQQDAVIFEEVGRFTLRRLQKRVEFVL
mmetsp:Transcript_2564/g.2812  ORF Transcript_2564/g.2812 Transcript_2564/m.2812 type:complete len:250 (-) Transcript_2564:211-960(-)